MFKPHPWIGPKYAWPGVSHNLPYLLSVAFAVAVDSALGAPRFAVAMGAVFQTRLCIVQQVITLGA